MMEARITYALMRLFERYRIVFWYDRQRELRSLFDALDLDDVDKIVLDNNEFAVKYHILREAPKGKFLLYHQGPQPEDNDNWLLDVLLAHGEFRTDQASLWLSQLELGPEYHEIVSDHEEFYRVARRVETLKKQVSNQDSFDTVRLRMLAVCVGSDSRLDAVLEALLAELAAGRDDAQRLIERCNLNTFLWKRVSADYGYGSPSPTVKDFALTLFKSCYALELGGESDLAQSALVLFNGWKNNRLNAESFTRLSDEFANRLQIKHDLGSRDYRTLRAVDHFELIERKIIHGLVADVGARTIRPADCDAIIAARRSSFWYAPFEPLYQAISHAAHLIALLHELDLSMNSLSEGAQRYISRWYLIDQHYRQFIAAVRQSGEHSLMSDLDVQIENLYTNNFLLIVNDRWQQWVDQAETWGAAGLRRQQDFFSDCVQPYLDRGNKIAVIISDALRYEIGDELMRLIRNQDRFDATLEAALTGLPSYTQLGMAALLPHQQLAIQPESGSSVVFVDGSDSRGLENRRKLLARCGKSATALKVDDLIEMQRDERRALYRDHDVIYVYHNRIDAVGDKRDSEERVFDEAAAALDELVRVIKVLANANASNILVTADHGFIYQNAVLDESDFLGAEPQGDQITFLDRRFVIGTGLIRQPGFKHFTAAQVGLAGDLEFQFPKSINRLRKKGAGSRYVHGGTALQEVIIPVIHINKKRTSDVRRVGVEIVRGAQNTITSGQFIVHLYQKESVSEKVQARMLTVGLYNRAGDLISDSQELIFDSPSANERERQRSVRLILLKDADASNNQAVYVKLQERIEGTTHYEEYDSREYLLRRSFTSDFDF